jgi:carbon-monoxide dehydrogenase large subunit
VAETLEQARDAAGAIVADITELPAVVDMAQAVANPDLRVHDEIANNVCFDWGWIEDNRAAVDAAFKAAPHVTTLELVNNRLVPNAMEPRASIGDYDPGTGDYKLYTTSQNPHVARLVLSAFIGIAPEHKLRVIAPDVGGGFGSKIFIYAEETVCVWAAKKVGRPVKWVADRTEEFLCVAHGRDHLTHAEMAIGEDGRILGLRVKTRANLGAYLSTFASSVPTSACPRLRTTPSTITSRTLRGEAL